jgi:F0F1-type ATP synthase assembly protein I
MKSKDGKNTPWWQPGMLLFFRLSGWIIGPVILGLIIGKWLDKKFGTAPWLFLITIGLSFILSMFGIVRDAMKAMKEIERDAQESKLKSKSQNSKPKN